MPHVLEELVVDRVDLVDEGANSAAFIELFKRKENKPMDFSEIISKMKPEHAEVINQHIASLSEDLKKARKDADEANSKLSEQEGKLSEANDALAKANDALTKANDALAKATEELETAKAASTVCTCDGEADDSGVCKGCGKPKNAASFDEAEVLKSMPENLRAEFIKMREQKEAAEEQVRKAAEEKIEADAVAKAASLKSLPVEQTTLVNILKSCDQAVVDVLSAVAAAIDNTTLTEVGKAGKGKVNGDAWDKIEAEANKIAERDSVTKQKAIGIAIKENPELYREYLNGGKN